MSIPQQLTDTPTPWPAYVAWGEPKYYTPEYIDYIEERDRKAAKKAADVNINVVQPIRGGRVCSECDKRFIPTNANNWTCSIACEKHRKKIRQAKWREDKIRLANNPVLVRHCPACDTTFETTNARKVTCSPDCSRAHGNRKQRGRAA